MLLEEPSLLVFVIVADNCIHYGDSKRQSFTSPSFGTTNHVLSLHCWLKNSSLNRLQNRRKGSISIQYSFKTNSFASCMKPSLRAINLSLVIYQLTTSE